MTQKRPFHCNKCTALKVPGWSYCPFCGENAHFCYGEEHERIPGAGGVPSYGMTTDEYREMRSAEQQGQTQASDGTRYAPENIEFESAVKVIRTKFDDLKRVRVDRDRTQAALIKAEEELRQAKQDRHKLRDQLGVKTIEVEQLQGLNIDLQEKVKKHEESLESNHAVRRALEERVSQMQRQRPEPFKLAAVYGQKEGEHHLRALPILEMVQGGGSCTVTVGIP